MSLNGQEVGRGGCRGETRCSTPGMCFGTALVNRGLMLHLIKTNIQSCGGRPTNYSRTTGCGWGWVRLDDPVAQWIERQIAETPPHPTHTTSRPTPFNIS